MGEIKCIAYVSKAPLIKRGVVLPVGLSEIVKSAKRNESQELTGLLSYRKGYYVQVIEGPEHSVDSLISKIFEDNRHLDPLIFINKYISKRCFNECNISVFDFVDQNHMFEKLLESYKSDIQNLSIQQKQRIQHVYDVDAHVNSSSDTNKTTKNYDGKNVKLIAWPDFNRINHSPALMNLCIKLTKESHPFEQLVNDGEFGTREEVTDMIRNFDALSILEVSASDYKAEEKQQITENKKPSRFYGAIKKFLGMG